MRYAYLVIESFNRINDQNADATVVLDLRNMPLRWRKGSSCIYASADTPVIEISDNGVLIGDVYTRTGERLLRGYQFPALASTAALRDYILQNCWGDYILAQSDPEHSRSLDVLRSPSHACELPCFYSISDSHGFVTSDISLASGAGLYRRSVDYQSITHRLIYPSIKMSSSGLEGITELLPGHTLQLKHEGLRLTQNWNPWAFVTPELRYTDMEEAARAVRNAVAMVIRAMADRDEIVLLELSGGLDSSIVAACLGLSTAEMHCMTITSSFPGTDERDYAAAVASTLNAGLSEMELQLADAAFDFPIPSELASPAVGPLQYAVDRLMQRSASRLGANSAFSGAGGDTVFGFLTSAAPAADAFLAAGCRTGMRAIHDLATFHQCTYWKAGRLALGKMLRGDPELIVDRSFTHPRLATPAPQLHPWMVSPPRALPADKHRIHELSGTQSFRDTCLRSFVRPLRMPLLSQPVIEACLRTPSWMWFAGGQNRAVARKAFSDILPRGVLRRKSKGTMTAYLGALHRRKKREIIHFLVDGQLREERLLDADALLRLDSSDQSEDEPTFMRLFHLCILENWVRQQARCA